MVQNADTGHTTMGDGTRVVDRFKSVHCRFADATKAALNSLSEKQCTAQQELIKNLQDLRLKCAERENELKKEYAAAVTAGDAEKAQAAVISLRKAWLDSLPEYQRVHDAFWESCRHAQEECQAERRDAYRGYLKDLKNTWSSESDINPAELFAVAQKLSWAAVNAATLESHK
jgi:hypothetical protein